MSKLVASAIEMLKDFINNDCNGNLSEAARILDINYQTLTKWIHGTRTPTLTKITPFIEYIGASLVRPTIQRSSANTPLDIATGDTEEIKIYEIAGGGKSWALNSQEPIIKVYIPISYFKKAEHAFLVEGDSMHPTIKNGAIVGINSTLPFHPNEIYALNLHEGIVVKRVSVNQINKTYVIRSDNQDKNHYPDYEVPMVEQENIFIGRVVWVWQNL